MSKPRPPKLNLEKLSRRDDFKALRNRLQQYEEERKAGLRPTTDIALEALAAFLGGRLQGHSDEELRTTWPEEWGDEVMEVPVVLIDAIARAWVDYKAAPSGTTMCEAFKVKGRGQGSHPLKAKMATRDRQRRLMTYVEAEYFSHSERGSPISEDTACGLVADSTGEVFSTVKEAHRKFKASHRAAMRREGLLPPEGEETS